MSFNDKMTAISDAFRNQYGTTDKYGLDDMPALIDGLEPHNFLSTSDFEATMQSEWIHKDVPGLTVELWNKELVGKTVVISCDVEWRGYHSGAIGDRLFYEAHTKTVNGAEYWNGVYYTPESENGKTHLAQIQKLADQPISELCESHIYDELNVGSYLKITNLRIAVIPVGGVVPPNLFDGYLGFEPAFVKRQGNLYSFDMPHYGGPYVSLVFSNDKADLSSYSKLRLSFKARGNGSVWTYLYGNNYNGTYVDNGKEWRLTDTWQGFSQDFSREAIPLSALFDLRTLEHNSGEVTDLKLVKLK